MKRRKAIHLSETTSIDVPTEQLTPTQLIQLQARLLLKQSETHLQLSRVRLQQAITMSKMIDILKVQFAAQNPAFGVQKLIKDRSDDRHLN